MFCAALQPQPDDVGVVAGPGVVVVARVPVHFGGRLPRGEVRLQGEGAPPQGCAKATKTR